MKTREIKERISFNTPLKISKGIVNADADIVGREISDFFNR